MKKIKSLNIPFFYGVQKDKNNGGIPSVLPFKYSFDEDLKLYSQESDDKLRQILQDIYLKGSMLNGEMNALDGGHQGKAALDFIYKSFSDLKNKRVLEIGCGNGFILKELIKKGATCVGLEPGPQIEEADLSNGDIELINDFFPSSKISGKFDLILHFNVLEHLENPVQSLKEQGALLNDSGKIIFGMPNSEPNLQTGDISIFAHEHFNYFTRDSFIYIAKSAGLVIDSITTGASNGMIFCSFMKENGTSTSNYIDSGTKWSTFDDKIDASLKKLKQKLEEYSQKDIAIYCPKRALNALSIIGINDCRLVDDTVDMFGNYFPFFNNTIENFNSLIKNPPKVIIIFSRTFGNEIKRKCEANAALQATKLFLLEDFDE
jgi:2-polyprenyl-3-methyl-5-hydroxy-6-metoxy-1,4-benzoquinol methylase